MIGQKEVPIGPDDTALDVFQKLEPAAEEVLGKHLEGILNGTAPRHPQDHSQATYFGGRKPEDGKILWNVSAREIHNLVRAVTYPYPGAFGVLRGQKIMIWKTKVQEALPEWKKLPPGTVFVHEAKLLIKAGSGAIEPVEISAGEKKESAPPDLLLTPGDIVI
jgi:methionyl-tRNA formyltransferase